MSLSSVFGRGPYGVRVPATPWRETRLITGRPMERIWLKSYPEGVPAEIDLSALGSLGDFIADERRQVSRPHRLHQHGQGDVLWRTPAEVARVRRVPAECHSASSAALGSR